MDRLILGPAALACRAWPCRRRRRCGRPRATRRLRRCSRPSCLRVAGEPVITPSSAPPRRGRQPAEPQRPRPARRRIAGHRRAQGCCSPRTATPIREPDRVDVLPSLPRPLANTWILPPPGRRPAALLASVSFAQAEQVRPAQRGGRTSGPPGPCWGRRAGSRATRSRCSRSCCRTRAPSPRRRARGAAARSGRRTGLRTGRGRCLRSPGRRDRTGCAISGRARRPWSKARRRCGRSARCCRR